MISSLNVLFYTFYSRSKWLKGFRSYLQTRSDTQVSTPRSHEIRHLGTELGWRSSIFCLSFRHALSGQSPIGKQVRPKPHGSCYLCTPASEGWVSNISQPIGFGQRVAKLVFQAVCTSASQTI